MRITIITMLVSLLVPGVAFGVKPGPSVPAVQELKGLSAMPVVFEVARSKRPLIELTTAEDASKYFEASVLEKLLEKVDFGHQFVLIFAWPGSGHDNLTFNGSVATSQVAREVNFHLARSPYRDFSLHMYVYALRSASSRDGANPG